ncbi:hypothetical protein ABZ734_02475 [Streptomyces sp. NPDC006660]|uniref:hypothetical protein n=1 Tax=Streptomyces sp. NPDC006660 TaxID=3156901 RepID=UPI0033CDB983
MLDVLHHDRLALRIGDGAFFAMDRTARHPRTGELMSTGKFRVQILAAVGEVQRELKHELTHDGLRGAEAKANKGGRRPALMGETNADVRAAACPESGSIAALARNHGVIGVPPQSGRAFAIRQLVLQAPAPVVATALGYHDRAAIRLLTEAGGIWSRFAPGDRSR